MQHIFWQNRLIIYLYYVLTCLASFSVSVSLFHFITFGLIDWLTVTIVSCGEPTSKHPGNNSSIPFLNNKGHSWATQWSIESCWLFPFKRLGRWTGFPFELFVEICSLLLGRSTNCVLTWMVVVTSDQPGPILPGK